MNSNYKYVRKLMTKEKVFGHVGFLLRSYWVITILHSIVLRWSYRKPWWWACQRGLVLVVPIGVRRLIKPLNVRIWFIIEHEVLLATPLRNRLVKSLMKEDWMTS